jgi:hypothetical protein
LVVDSTISVLFVEPETSAQLDLLDEARRAHSRVDLTCVSTCGGGSHALEETDVDCLLLSSNLALYEDERGDLRKLVQRARTLGLAVLSLGLVPDALLGLPRRDSLTYAQVAHGQLARAVAQAMARATTDVALTAVLYQDRLALAGRAFLSGLGSLWRHLDGARRELAELAIEGGPGVRKAEQELDRMLEDVASIRARFPESPCNGGMASRARPETVFERALIFTTSVIERPLSVQRRFESNVDVVVDEELLGHTFINLLLAISGRSDAEASVDISTRTSNAEVIVEFCSPSIEAGLDSLADPFEPRSLAAGPSGLALWAGRRLLARWGVQLDAGDSVNGRGSAFRLVFPAAHRTMMLD